MPRLVLACPRCLLRKFYGKCVVFVVFSLLRRVFSGPPFTPNATGTLPPSGQQPGPGVPDRTAALGGCAGPQLDAQPEPLWPQQPRGTPGAARAGVGASAPLTASAPGWHGGPGAAEHWVGRGRGHSDRATPAAPTPCTSGSTRLGSATVLTGTKAVGAGRASPQSTLQCPTQGHEAPGDPSSFGCPSRGQGPGSSMSLGPARVAQPLRDSEPEAGSSAHEPRTGRADPRRQRGLVHGRPTGECPLGPGCLRAAAPAAQALRQRRAGAVPGSRVLRALQQGQWNPI